MGNMEFPTHGSAHNFLIKYQILDGLFRLSTTNGIMAFVAWFWHWKVGI
jgi:hypothetical protein